MPGALQGVKVIELAQIMAGPTCGMLLADMGADVIKVEKLPGGDDTRSWGPPFASDGSAAYFHSCNRGKSSVCLDFTDPADLEQVRALIASADIGGIANITAIPKGAAPPSTPAARARAALRSSCRRGSSCRASTRSRARARTVTVSKQAC